MLLQTLSLIVLSLTLGAVIWYTIVTRRMQQAIVEQASELVRQRHLSNMPAFVADIQRCDAEDYLELTNIGKGLAINVSIDNVVIRYPTIQSGHIEFDRVIRIPVGASALIESREFPFAEGTKYVQSLRMGTNGFEFGFVRLDGA